VHGSARTGMTGEARGPDLALTMGRATEQDDVRDRFPWPWFRSMSRVGATTIEFLRGRLGAAMP